MTPRAILIRKHDLEIKLQQIGPHPRPKAVLEQYTIPAHLAAEILFEACYVHDDIEKKTVADLGTGTGRFAIGASMLGAKYVVGVDLDLHSLMAAMEKSKQFGITANWVLGDISILRGMVDTILMNPPFGTKQAHADQYFLETALNLSRVVYSIHKSSTRSFITRFLRNRAEKSEKIISTRIEIPHQFPFHQKKRSYVEVDVFRIQPN